LATLSGWVQARGGGKRYTVMGPTYIPSSNYFSQQTKIIKNSSMTTIFLFLDIFQFEQIIFKIEIP